MSKLIVDTPMPHSCFDCPCHNGESGYCQADKYHRYIYNDIPSWCPIKGVLPETHGRLIDEAAFCENVVKYSHQSTKTIGKALDATPTIIDMTLIDTERSET